MDSGALIRGLLPLNVGSSRRPLLLQHAPATQPAQVGVAVGQSAAGPLHSGLIGGAAYGSLARRAGDTANSNPRKTRQGRDPRLTITTNHLEMLLLEGNHWRLLVLSFIAAPGGQQVGAICPSDPVNTNTSLTQYSRPSSRRT